MGCLEKGRWVYPQLQDPLVVDTPPPCQFHVCSAHDKGGRYPHFSTGQLVHRPLGGRTVTFWLMAGRSTRGGYVEGHCSVTCSKAAGAPVTRAETRATLHDLAEQRRALQEAAEAAETEQAEGRARLSGARPMVTPS
jgi:hypothetical protein